MKVMIKNIDKLINKYELKVKSMTIMDDYDGGRAREMREIVSELKKLKKEVDKSEKSGILEV